MVVNPGAPATPPPEHALAPSDDRPALAHTSPPPAFPALAPSAQNLPRRVRIVEVGPRDGLQNEAVRVPAGVKQRLVHDLVDAGLRAVEVTAFVSKRRVPQLADAKEVMRGVRRHPNTRYLACVPNMRGLQDAIAAGAHEVAIMAAASDAFSKRNINCTIDEAIARYEEVVHAALREGVRVRAYVSCALGCPYSGVVPPAQVAHVAKRMYKMGCYEVALGDTIGVGNPRTVVDVITAVVESGVPVDCIAVHFHDTQGIALANVLAAMSVGVSVVDSSIAGLGGCPFAPGSAGNLATEDLVHMLQGMQVDVGDIDLKRLVGIGNAMCRRLGCETRSRVAQSINAMKRNLA